MDKQECLDHYRREIKARGRDLALAWLDHNIAGCKRQGEEEKVKIRLEVRRELFEESITDSSWDKQLADLLGPTTPIYITE